MKTNYLTQNQFTLPGSSRRPEVEKHAISPEIINLLKTVKESLKEVEVKMTSPLILSSPEIADTISKLNTDLIRVLSYFKRYLGNNAFKGNSFEESPSGVKRSFHIYDQYFNIERVSEMPNPYFVYQSIRIINSALSDLVHSPVALEELIALLTGVGMIFTLLTEGKEEGGAIPLPEKDVDTAGVWVPSQSDTVAYALHRWKTHHALYDLVLIYSAEELISANIQIDNHNYSQASIHIDRARIFFRVSTSAMWCASIFPSSTYCNIVRPSMVSTDAPHGFSGGMNREFDHWSIQQEELRSRVEKIALVPNELFEAVKRFSELFIQDGEHHILIAAAMVGDLTSLTQSETEKKRGLKYQYGAVDILRNILQNRKDSWKFFENKTKL